MINAEKYYELRQQMYKLHNDINELQNMNDKLVKKLANTLLLDNKIVGNKEFEKIASNYQKVDRIVLDDIIARI